jgi:Tfp pilus assembly protein PilF
MKKRSIIRDFWFVLLLCYGLIGLTLVKAEGTNLNQAMALVNEGRTDEALSILRQEIERNPQQSDVHLGLGVAYLQKGDFASAQSSLERALSMNPQSVPAHYSLAMLYEKQRAISRAIGEWQQVLRLSTDASLRDLAGKHIKQLEGIR